MKYIEVESCDKTKTGFTCRCYYKYVYPNKQITHNCGHPKRGMNNRALSIAELFLNCPLPDLPEKDGKEE